MSRDVQPIKQRFGIIGSSPKLDRAIEIAMQVAPTDLTVLITGESGSGKEVMPQILHQLSTRKHGPYIAVNCGAIPEGTIDSELFGHEKGSFTGAQGARKGYFEEADGGTIFLDEVAELPFATQARLLRVLETGEYLRVGSSKVQKTNVRVVAATNVNMLRAIEKKNFREDLYYRLNTVPIQVPALRERKEDIHLLFRKFTTDFAEKYRMPPMQLDEEAQRILRSYRWPGNVRQLKNITEQISVIEAQRDIDAATLRNYLPDDTGQNLPAIVNQEASSVSERELLYKVLFEMKRDLHDVKALVAELMKDKKVDPELVQRVYEGGFELPARPNDAAGFSISMPRKVEHEEVLEHTEVEESLSLEDTERELIKKALKKHRDKRKQAANELGISERTLYRKIKEYDLK